MNWKNSLYILCTLLVLGACSNDTTEDGLEINFTLSGKIDGAANQALYLEAMSQDGTIDVAKSETNSDGSFEFSGNIPDMGIYQLRLGEGDDKIVPLTLMPKDKVVIKGTFETFALEPKFEGTEWAKPLSEYMRLFNEFAKKQTAMAQEQQGQATDEQMMEKYKVNRAPIDEFAIAQMKKEPSNPVNIILSSSLSPTLGFKEWDVKNLSVLKSICVGFTKRFPNSPITANMKNQLVQMETAYTQYLQYEEQQKSGAPAPEISMRNPEGKELKLSSLRGKYVLIDFWASWCGPCRKENPNVVKLYEKYKNKDFTIFSVSLDQDKEAWKNAILMDGLIWPNHVSDLLAWNTPLTRLYGFQSIPHTVLIDKQGKIIARNLRGEALEQKLREIL